MMVVKFEYLNKTNEEIRIYLWRKKKKKAKSANSKRESDIPIEKIYNDPSMKVKNF